MPLDSRSDVELVEAANRGEARAFETIYLRHRDWAFRLACRFTADHDLAADVVQEAFLYLFRKFGSSSDQRGLVLRAKLTTLLYPAIRNTALAARRKKSPLPLAENFDAPADHIPRTSDEDRAHLARLLARLNDGQREVLLMRAIDGMNTAEIAAALGIPEGTVKSRLHHALAALRQDHAAPDQFL
jgi:RNA polymerase sigma-70 factor, ECF subfamily